LHGAELKRHGVDEDTVKGIGIDTLLFWNGGVSGWRCPDNRLQIAYPAVPTSVITCNGLYGAMTVQGMLLAYQLREKYSNVLLNETHPKLLYRELSKNPYPLYETETVKGREKVVTINVNGRARKVSYNWEDDRKKMRPWLTNWIEQSGLTLSIGPAENNEGIGQIRNSHCWDALISACATYMGKKEAWPETVENKDWPQGVDLIPNNREPKHWPLAGDLHYYWPRGIPTCKASVPQNQYRAGQPTRCCSQRCDVQ
jgi:hypothetical protein